MKGRRLLTVLTAGILLCAHPASAVTVDWDDLTDAQQEEAYKTLESENESLRAQLAQLQGSGVSAENGSGGSASGGSADSNAAAQLKDTDTFLADLAGSFAKRQEAAAKYSNEQLAQMSAEDLWTYRFECAEAERDFYNTYSDAQFNSLNVLYLCSEYTGGLGKQFQAEEVWNSTQDADQTGQLYTAGYYNRAYALVELHDYYGLDLADGYQNLRDAVSKMDAAGGEETRNAGTDPGTVKMVQELLNQLGFLCGEPDGICGRQTVSCIERFQNMYGFTPADGLIDDELISQMQNMLAKQGG